MSDLPVVGEQSEYVVRTPGDVLACAAEATSACGDWRIRSVVEELLMNAVEHGNLEVGFELKRELLLDGGFAAEIERRLGRPEYSERSARLVRRFEDDVWQFEVSDDGSGFDWARWLEPSTGVRLARNGRGIGLARMLGIAELEYNGPGNRVRIRFQAKSS